MAEFRGALGDPEAYSRALDGDRPINISTLELLAQSPVNTEAPARAATEAATMMAEAPGLGLPGSANGPTIVTEAPVLPESAQATRLLDAPQGWAPPPAPPPPAPSTGAMPTLTPTARPRGGSGSSVALVVILMVLLLGGGGAGAYFFLLKPKLDPVVVTSDPPGAQVLREGQPLGRTPLVIQLPHGAPAIQVVLRKDGYLDAKQSLDPAGEPAVLVKLHAREEDPKPIKVQPVVTPQPPQDEPKKPTTKPTRPTKKPTKKKEHFDDDVLEPHF